MEILLRIAVFFLVEIKFFKRKLIYVLSIQYAILYSFFLYLWKFSGQNDELTDEDYDGNYSDEITSESVEMSPSLLTTISEGTNEQTVDKFSEATTTPSSPTVVFTVPTTKIMEAGKPIKTTTGKIHTLLQSVYMKNTRISCFFLFFAVCSPRTKMSTEMPLLPWSSGLFASKFTTTTKGSPVQYDIT